MSDGYVYSNVSTSKSEAISKKPLGRGILITKAAIQQYIANWFDSNGIYRKILTHQVPVINRYITDKKFEADQFDRSKRYIQLARMFGNLKEELPAILISEESVLDVPSGLGDYFKSTRVNAYTQVATLHKILELNIKVMIGAQDEESFSLLSESLGLIFGTLRQLVGSSIQSTTPGLRWEVTLPIRATLPPTPNGVQVADSQIDKVWVGELSLEKVRFEAFSQIEYTLGKLQPDPLASGITFHPDANMQTDFPVRIIAPTTGKVGQAVHIQIDRRRPQSRVYIDNPDVAYIDTEALILRPKRIGEVTIYVVDQSYVTGMADGIHASHTMQIVY